MKNSTVWKSIFQKNLTILIGAWLLAANSGLFAAENEALEAKAREAIKSAVNEEMPLTKLSESQKKILNEEILNRPTRFLSRFKAAQGGYEVEVERPLVSSVLLSTHSGVKVCLRFDIAPSCERCKQQYVGVRNDWNSRLSRRNAEVQLLNVKKVEKNKKAAKSAQEGEKDTYVAISEGQFISSINEGKCNIGISVTVAPVAGFGDEEHPEDKKFESKATVLFRDSVELPVTLVQLNQAKKSGLRVEWFESQEAVDAFESQFFQYAKLARRKLSESVSVGVQQQEELQTEISIRGVKDLKSRFELENSLEAEFKKKIPEFVELKLYQSDFGHVIFITEPKISVAKAKEVLTDLKTTVGTLTFQAAGSGQVITEWTLQ